MTPTGKLSREWGTGAAFACLVYNEMLAHQLVTLPNIASNRRAMILYTSGTTSRPKGVVTTHEKI